jgi:hypothetical protein
MNPVAADVSSLDLDAAEKFELTYVGCYGVKPQFPTAPVSILLLAALVWLVVASSSFAGPLDYAPAPADNPLKGFVPYAGQAGDFPHSLEFNYLPVNAVMRGPDSFEWRSLERLLTEVASRGCQTVFRFYLEYPNKPTGVPQFLLEAGVGIRTNVVPGTEAEEMLTPDYEDQRLRIAMTNFIFALGRRYDGDPRIGFITAGFLGKWGEWHDHPFTELWASKAVQREVMDAYEAAFKKTPVLLRYPAGENDSRLAANHRRSFGYHDDSFAWATLPTGRKGDSWYFLTRVQGAGTEAMDKWRMRPIGGEVRPEVWRGLWDEPSSTPKGQEFLRCVEATHATWLMDSSISRKLAVAQRNRAIAGARRLGYEFHISTATLEVNAAKRQLLISVTLRNLGVAPFYADWPAELGAFDAQGKMVATWPPDWKLSGLLPGDAERRWAYAADMRGLSAGDYRLLLRLANPMAGGRPLRFANRAQDEHLSGWLTLGEFKQEAQ